MDQCNILWRRVLSYFKKTWAVEDYPLRYQKQVPNSHTRRMFGSIPLWRVLVVNWPQMDATGETKQEALAALKERFVSHVSAGGVLPRPGNGIPLSFAPNDRIARNEPLAREFLREMLGLDYDQSYFSNDSSLHYCVYPDEIEALIARIEAHFGIEVPNRDSLLIAEILEAIEKKRGAEIEV